MSFRPQTAVAAGPGAGSFSGTEMKTFRGAWANRANKPCNILIMGDSVSAGYYASTFTKGYAYTFLQRLCQANGQTLAPGYVPMSSIFGSGWTGRLWTQVAGTVADRAQVGLNYTDSSISATTGVAERVEICDRFWVLFPRYAAGTGTFRVRMDGTILASGISTTGTLKGTNGWDSGPLTHGSHAVRIEADTGTLTVSEGAYFFDGNGNTSGSMGALSAANAYTGSGIRVWSTGRAGDEARDFCAVDPTSGAWWTDGLDIVNPHLIILQFGINDQRAGVETPAQYQANMSTALDRIATVQAANGNRMPSVLMLIPYATGLTATASTEFIRAAKRFAVIRGCAMFDMNELLGFVGTAAVDDAPAGIAVMNPTDPTNDKIHPNDKGHALIGEALARYVLDAVGPTPDVSVNSLRVTGTDGTGKLAFQSNTAAVPTPPVNSVQMYALKKSGRDLLYRQGFGEDPSPMMPSPMGSLPWGAFQGSGSTAPVGLFAAISANGTVSHPAPTDATGPLTAFAGAASANAISGINSVDVRWMRGTPGGIGGGFFFHSRVRLPDASYNESGATTGARIRCGLSDQTVLTSLASDNPAGNRCMFERISNNGGRIQTTWNFTMKDNTTENITNTTMPFTQNNLYDLWIWCPPGGTSITWLIEDKTAATSATGVITANLPVTTTPMRAMACCLTINAVARNFQHGRVWCEIP